MDEFHDHEDFVKVLDNMTNQACDELNHCFIESKSTRLVNVLNWPRDMSLLTYRSNSCIPIKEDIERLVEDEENCGVQAVKIRRMNIDWLLRDKKNIVGLAGAFEGQPDNFYATEFVNNILEEFWRSNQKKIIRRQFVPYLCYLLTSVFFMSMALRERDPDEN